MSYIEHSLGQSEVVLYRARFPWFLHASGWAILAAFTSGAIVAYANGYEAVAAASLLLGLALFLAILTPLWTAEIGVTNQRLIYKRGLMWRTTQELQLRSVEGVELEQGVIGRLLNYGRLQLHGTGVEDIHLPSLADPVGLRKALQNGMTASTRQDAVVEPAPEARAERVHHPAA